MEHGQVESSNLHWGWDGDEARHWTLYALGGKDMTVLIKLCSEEPEIMTGTLGPLRAAKLLICKGSKVTYLRLAHSRHS